jgi:dienelactone hydrolase
MRRLFPLSVSVAVLAGCAGIPAVRNGAMPTGPLAGDSVLSPFYATPTPLPERPGVMLRNEPIAAQPELSAAGTQQRILYTSTDARWSSGVIPVSGTLYLPKGEPPAGGWPLVAWAHGTLGVADLCAPSWTGHKGRDASYINRWLQQGFAVVASDYQGLGGPGPHPYLFWEAEGRSVLDAVRAALAANPGRVANELVITGQSQGSASSIGASRIQPAYAPELKLRATIATGVLPAFPQGPVKLTDSVPGAKGTTRYNMFRLVGGSLPEGGPTTDSLVRLEARPLLAMARETCGDGIREFEREHGIDMSNAFTVTPEKLEALMLPATEMSMVRMPAPLFLGTGLADRTIPPQRQYAAAAALCAAGTTLVWKTYPGITHGGGVHAAFDDELHFVRGVFAKQPVASNCGNLVAPGAPQPAATGIPFND